MLKFGLFLPISLSLLVISGCSDDKDPASPSGPKLTDFNGIWAQEGTGLVMSIDSDTVTTYQYTRATCSQQPSISSGKANKEYTRAQSENDQSFSVIKADSHEINRITFNKQDDLPVPCLNPQNSKAYNPEFMFKHFWSFYHDYYAFFGQREVDWDEQYQLNRSKVSENTSGPELFAVFEHMLSPLDDGQVRLLAEVEGESVEYLPEVLKGYDRYAEFITEQTDLSSFESYALLIEIFTDTLEDMYAIESFEHHQILDETNLVSWGVLENNIGYLQVNAMTLFTGDNEATQKEELRSVEKVMAKAMSVLNKTNSLIVDVRFNGGGYDSIAFAIASRFADKQRLAYRNQAYNTGSLTELRDFYVEPHEDGTYTKPITLITGPNTASTAELFTFAMRSLPHVKHIGQATKGSHSTTTSIELSEGWEADIPFEIVQDPEGQVYDATGIPPDVLVPVTSLSSQTFASFPAIAEAMKDYGVTYEVSQIEFEQEVSEILETAKIPGFSVSWISGDTLLGQTSFGYADLETQRPVTANTPFTLGSISKTFIGVSIAQALEEGIFTLDDSVKDLNPNMPINSPDETQDITLRHLVTHTSIINDSDYYDCSYYIEKDKSSLLAFFDVEGCPDPVETNQRDFLKSYLGDGGLLYDAEENYTEVESGEIYNYSNMGAALAADTLASATGIDFESWTEQRIFQPLAMTQTHWFRSRYSAEQELPATRYVITEDGQISLPEYQLSTWSDGGLKTSATDLSNYLLSIVKGGELNGHRILSASSVSNLLAGQSERITDEGELGIFWNNDGTIFGHNGVDPGTLSEMRYDQYNKLGFVFMMNATDVRSEYDDGSSLSIDDAYEKLVKLVYHRGLTLKRELTSK